MDIKKLAPWNWFRKEEEAGAPVPVQRADLPPAVPETGFMSPLAQLHREVDRLFESVFRGFGLGTLQPDLDRAFGGPAFLRPSVDVGATDSEYTITVEVPGVSEKDVKIEVADDTMTIRGEKRQEKEEKEKNYYRVERSYGAFQRVLCLPDDADQENIKATFKDGVLTIRMPRKSLPGREVKQIEIKAG
ncbi:MAG: Hsp20/alpha crystallin family protein [Desulfobulbaceae bacterium]